MKFKSVIIFFNILMLLFLGIMFVMPLIILGKGLALQFWHTGWYLAPLILAALAVLDLYFAFNYRIYTLLEKEDWPALVQELETKVLQKNHYSPRLVKLLISSYLVLSDVKSVTELEKRLNISKKSLINENALSFCAARILHKDYEGAVDFLESRSSGDSKQKGRDAEWLRWYYGFALLLSRRFEESADIFLLLAREGRELILIGLSAYFLSENLAAFLPLRVEDLRDAAKTGKERTRRSLYSRKDWEKELKRLETEVFSAVLQVYTKKAEDYLYK